MVPIAERRKTPDYSLERIRELASRGQIDLASRRVLTDTENYGYGPEELGRCLSALTKEDFRYAERYTPRGPWLDVYRCQWPAPDGSRTDDLYIKLRLSTDCMLVALFSFHPDR